MSFVRATLCGALLLIPFGGHTFGQTAEATAPRRQTYDRPAPRQKGKGAVRDIGHGAGSIGMGAARGTGDLAKGTANSALDLVTLHPIDATASLARGAGGAGKDIAVGTLKGTGQISRGVGKAIRKVL